MSKSPHLDFIVGSRDERETGYVYEYVYGEERPFRTTASSGRAERRAVETGRSAGNTKMNPVRWIACILKSATFIIALAGIAAVGIAGDGQTQAPQTGRVAYFSVEGFKGPAYHVNIRGTDVLYRGGPSYDEAGVTWRSFTVSEGEIQTLIERLTSIGLFEWTDQYICPFVADGVGWRVQIRWEGRRVDAMGSNKFPSTFDEMQKLVAAFVHAPFAIPIEECNE